MLASLFALLLVARSVAEAGAFALSARTSTAAKLDLRRKLVQAVLPWSPFDATRPPAGEIAALVVDQVETIDPFLVRYQIARLRMVVVPVAILVAILPVSWAVALILAVTGPLIPVFMALIGATARERSRRQLDEAGNLTGLLLDRLRGLDDHPSTGRGSARRRQRSRLPASASDAPPWTCFPSRFCHPRRSNSLRPSASRWSRSMSASICWDGSPSAPP